MNPHLHPMLHLDEGGKLSNSAVSYVQRRCAMFMALAAAGLTSVAVAAPVLAQSREAGQTIRFRELNKGSRVVYLDNPPRNTGHRKPVFSMGDELIIVNPVANSGGKIGELRATCTIMKQAAPPTGNSLNAFHPFCTGALVLRNGTLFVEAVDLGARATKGAVVGGTGAYAGAQGTYSGTHTKTGANDVVKLQP